MDKIRVVVANRSRLMRELVVATIGDQPDSEVIAETQNPGAITELVDKSRPDFLITASEDLTLKPVGAGTQFGRYKYASTAHPDHLPQVDDLHRRSELMALEFR